MRVASDGEGPTAKIAKGPAAKFSKGPAAKFSKGPAVKILKGQGLVERQVGFEDPDIGAGFGTLVNTLY